VESRRAAPLPRADIFIRSRYANCADLRQLGEENKVLRRGILVDPHPLWLDAVASALSSSDVEVVARSSDFETGLDLVDAHRPDLVVTDLPLQGVPDYLERLRALSRSMRVIVLTTVEDPKAVDAALGVGVAAYVTKTALPDDFTAAVRQAFSQSVYLPSSRDGAPLEHLDAEPMPAGRPALTHRELEILRPVANGASNADVAAALWITEQTVKFHLSNIYRKVGVANRTEAARWAQQHHVFGDEADSSPRAGS
jgi:DNA-binding NarL/FixJ family response regulator